MQDNFIDYLQQSAVLANLEPYMLSILAPKMQFRQLEPHEVLIEEGEYMDYLSLVLVGELGVIKNKPTGEQIHIETVSAGSCFGEIVLIDSSISAFTVRANELTGIATLSKKAFETVLSDYPRVAIEVLRGVALMLSLRLRQASEQLSQQC